jgi:quercetin dioxygenase-like cupin family protein
VVTISISSGRKFSLSGVQESVLVDGDVQVTLLCFEAGQRHPEQTYPTDSVYQVLEGETLVRAVGQNLRLGKGKLLKVPGGTAHSLENAGGGLLVVMASRRGEGT